MDTGNFVGFICFLLFSCDGFLSPSPASGFCPERCDCQQAQHILCTNRGLRAVPKVHSSRVPEDVLVFSLGGNFIGNISAFDFTRYGNLIRLNLQYNQIQTIHPKAFDKLSKLEELYLGNNLISTIPPGTLQSLTKLTTLNGNNNYIKKITPELFGNLESVVKLRLDGNAIELLQDSVFKSLTNLHYLHLESNQLSHIHRNAFSKLTKLRFLNLAQNKLTAVLNVFTFSQLRSLNTLLLAENEIQLVGNHVFQNLKKLSKLSLSNNKIYHLESEALKGLSSLTEFLIDGNELEDLPAGLLDPLERVEELDFSRNQISTVDPSAFEQLKHLSVLKLKDNRLTSLSGNIFALNSGLYDLDLHGNNWTCDCQLGELKQWMKSAHSQGKLLAVFVQCHHPATLRGKYLDYINSSQLQPPGNLSHLCETQTGPEESRGGGVLEKELEDRMMREGEERERVQGEVRKEIEGERRGIEVGREGVEMKAIEKVSRGREEEHRKEGEKEVGIQGDQGGQEERDKSLSSERKRRKKISASPRSRPSAEASGKREKGRWDSVPGRSVPQTQAPPLNNPTPPTTTTTRPQTVDNQNSHGNHLSWPITELLTTSPPTPRKEERFDLLRGGPGDGIPAVTDPCVFNRHFITNVTVDQVASSTATVRWTTRDYSRFTPGAGPGIEEVHYRVLFDRFGSSDRFPRYVYARGGARSVMLRELSPDVTYMVCVEGVVGGSVCQVAPRDHCAGLVTLPEEAHHQETLTSDLQLVTVATLAGNAVLLLVIGGVWLGRGLRRKLKRRKSAVHVRHMYSTRRPFRSSMTTTAAVSTDFTSFQSSRPPWLGTLEEGGDLIEFPCDRFLDNSPTRRDNSDMQRFSD
ncbi:TLR4 interactor with leucine rich repeats-like [Coregonus clupeaformis]|uniref:TLR4 interactor with leucine rich repeats-like n=1 Tax=Coregonus clupeaformis TaxID=59861 RepID=UPI001BDFD18E|nr:TLR4 interactor with leucine rich repeats-like [Coregonus clupeaformis]